MSGRVVLLIVGLALGVLALGLIVLTNGDLELAIGCCGAGLIALAAAELGAGR